MLDLTGLRFSRLTVLRIADATQHRKRLWQCLCDCGNIVKVTTGNLRSSNSESCGCLRLEKLNERFMHGRNSSDHTYRVWSGMRSRCNTPTNAKYRIYGGRGIKVCARWDDFEMFLADMGEAPEGLSIDRIDVNGNYEPSNCRWATPLEQSRNRRPEYFRTITYKGRSQILTDWCEELQIPYLRTLKRLLRGRSIAEAFESPDRYLNGDG